MSKYVDNLVEPICPHHFIKISDFYFVEGANYVRLSELLKCENDVITWRGVGNFEWKPQLVVGGQDLPLYAKNQNWKPSSFFNQLGIYKYIYTHIYIQVCVLIVKIDFNKGLLILANTFHYENLALQW